MDPGDVIPPMPQKPDRSWASLKRKMYEQPFVPLGLMVTVGFLLRGLKAAKEGRRLTASQSMKGRVIAQGCTAVVVLFGIYFQKNKRTDEPKISLEQKLKDVVNAK